MVRTLSRVVDARTLEVLRVRAPQLAEEFGLTAIYLVGSRARGDHGSDSDVDLAVLPKVPKVPKVAHDDALALGVELAARLEPALGLPVDVMVLDLHRMPLPLLASVLREAVLVDSRDESARVAFEVTAMALTLDFEIHAGPLRRAALAAMAARKR